jgi:geranylgeranyl diphosphate/geranylgeranyl-bacteriochlorophyllide a reductase
MHARKIAVVGGGPAGSFVAAEMAQAGRDVLLFDEKLAWEKPCGGGLTNKALTRWPFLRDAAVEHNSISCCELISPSGRKILFELDREIAIFSRLTLNGYLLDRAHSAGARLVRERVVEIEGVPGQWQVRSNNATYDADYLVLAAGARNPFRAKFSSPLGPENFMIAAGYYIPGTSQTVYIKFIHGLHGYIWVFPRYDHLSVGICGRMRDGSTAELRRTLEAFLSEFGLTLDGARFYAHIIPSLSVNVLANGRFCGEGWAMVGDAAGFVDAVTGEGIFYALRSAELLAEALLADSPEHYAALVKNDFLRELEHASGIADRFYAGEWMGGPVIERMVQLTDRSPRFRALMRDLFSGAQDYSTLKQRLYRSLPKIAAEALVSTLWKQNDNRAILQATETDVDLVWYREQDLNLKPLETNRVNARRRMTHHWPT